MAAQTTHGILCGSPSNEHSTPTQTNPNAVGMSCLTLSQMTLPTDTGVKKTTTRHTVISSDRRVLQRPSGELPTPDALLTRTRDQCVLQGPSWGLPTPDALLTRSPEHRRRKSSTGHPSVELSTNSHQRSMSEPASTEGKMSSVWSEPIKESAESGRR